MKTYHVHAGNDAFVITVDSDKIYLPFIPIFADTSEQAREKCAALIGIKLEDQDTNLDYDNYVDEAIEQK